MNTMMNMYMQMKMLSTWATAGRRVLVRGTKAQLPRALPARAILCVICMLFTGVRASAQNTVSELQQCMLGAGVPVPSSCGTSQPDQQGAVSMQSALIVQADKNSVGPCENPVLQFRWYGGHGIYSIGQHVSGIAASFNRPPLTLCGQPTATTNSASAIWIGIGSDEDDPSDSSTNLKWLQCGHIVHRSRFVPGQTAVLTQRYVEHKDGRQDIPSNYTITYFPAGSAAVAGWSIQSINPQIGWYAFEHNGTILSNLVSPHWTGIPADDAQFLLEVFHWGNLMGGTASQRCMFSNCNVAYNGGPLQETFFDDFTKSNDRVSEWVVTASGASFDVWDTLP